MKPHPFVTPPPRTAVRHPVLPRAMVLFALGHGLTTAIQADLYVTRAFTPGDSQPTGVLRFNEGTGAFINQASPPAEQFRGIEVSGNGNVFALDNTLGAIRAHQFTSTLGYVGVFGPSYPPPALSLYFHHDGLTIAPGQDVLVAAWLTTFGPNPPPAIPGVFKLDHLTGQLTSTTPFASAPAPYDLQYGPNGNLFVSDRALGVLEFDGTTGSLLRTVVADNGSTVDDVRGISFGPDGALYLATGGTDTILRFDTVSQVLSTFVPDNSGLNLDISDIDFGPDGNLYVAERGLHTVMRFRGSDGLALGEFTTGGAALFGVGGPQFLSFPPVPEASTTLPLTALALGAAIWAVRRRSA